MNDGGKMLLQAGDFAKRVGVTVRTLHHYDRLGLLKPSGYTQAGFRLYSERDLIRLQQIVTLKFIGLSLKEIKTILARKPLDLATTLRIQHEMLVEKRRRLDCAIEAIAQAESVIATNGEPDWEAFRRIIEVIEMQQNTEWMKKYYTDEQLAELGKRWSPELQERIGQEWATLLKEVDAASAAGVDPASAEAQALAERWSALINEFTGGDPAIAESLKNLYADEANWSPDFKKPFSDAAATFINKTMESRRKSAS